MPDMPECSIIGATGMCGSPDVAAAFPYICTKPPNPHTGEGAPEPLPGCTPAGAPAPAPAAEGAAVAAPAPLAAPAQASGARPQAAHGVALLLAAALAALLL